MPGRALLRGGFALAAVVCFLGGTTACGGGGGGGFGSAGLVSLNTTDVPPGVTGVAYAMQFSANFPNPPGRFIVTAGALPTGLELDSQTGDMTGYPRQVGTFHFTIGARDGVDQQLPNNRDATFAEARRDYSCVITRGPPNILPQQPPAAQYRASYGYQIDVAGGTPPYFFEQVGGTLPSGVTVSSSGFLGSFPASETPDASPYEFDVRVTDAMGLQDVEHLTLDVVVLPLLILTTSPLPEAAKDFPYDLTMQLASAGAGQPITWSQKPPGPGEILLSTIGMEITGNGHLRNNGGVSGPTTLGTFTFTLRVTDEASQVAERQYQLTVNPGPVLFTVNPRKSVSPPPYVLTGLNFQPGIQVIFKPGPNQSVVTPTGPNVTPTQITLTSTPPAPGGGGGFVTVRVMNPDGGFFDLANAFAFPASNLTFDAANPVFPSPQSSLSSTGLAVADLDLDGFADIVHVGSNSTAGSWGNATPTTAGVHVMLNNHPGGVFNGTFTQVVLDANASNEYEALALHDVDSDGDKDVVTTYRTGGTLRIRVWRNPRFPSNGSWASVIPQDTIAGYNGASTSFHTSDVVLGRVTPADSTADVAYSIQDNNSVTTSTWNMRGGAFTSMAGNGNGTFGATIETRRAGSNPIIDMFAIGGLAAGNGNNDNKEDFLFADEAGGYQNWNWGGVGTQGGQGQASMTNPSTGLLGNFVPLTRGGTGAQENLGTAFTDVNGHGNGDLILPAGHASWGASPGLGVFQGGGSGTFTYVAPATPASIPRYRYPVAFDGDFDIPLDLAISAADNRIDVYKGRTGSLGMQFRQTITLTAGSPKLGRIGSGDFNNDGRDDICCALSFFADQRNTSTAPNDRGNGSPLGVVIYLNSSN